MAEGVEIIEIDVILKKIHNNKGNNSQNKRSGGKTNANQVKNSTIIRKNLLKRRKETIKVRNSKKSSFLVKESVN